MRGHKRLILVALGLFFTVPGPGARAQAPASGEATVNVPVFPSGRLSPEQLASVVAAIRRLEANPLAGDGMEARRNLLVWLTASPDVTVKVCEIVPTTGETVRYPFFQFLVSSAAFIIEHPDQANDEVAVNLAGVQGALRTYQVLKARLGNEAKNGAMEELLKKQEQGQLEAHVRAGVARCNAGTAPR
jgi:hypothetical protein